MTGAVYLTAAAIVERAQRFLVVEERVRGVLTLNQPAGHREPGESFVDAVIRETHEETGGQFTPQGLVGLYLWERDNGTVIVRAAFTGGFDGEATRCPPDAEIIRSRWMSRDELEGSPTTLRGPLVLRCIDDYLAGQRLPLEVLGTVMSGMPVHG